jgi:hypothetical protein
MSGLSRIINPEPPLLEEILMIEHTRTASGLKRELRDFAENLTLTDFRALSAGLGIGQKPPRGMRFQPFHPEVTMPVPGHEVTPATAVKSQIIVETPKLSKVVANKGKHSQRKQRRPSNVGEWLMKFCIGHFIDLVFSAIAIVSMLSIAGMATQSVGFLPALSLAKGWIGALRPLEVLAALYGTFLLYVVIFHVLVGGTIGSQIVGRGTAKQQEPSA